jgi:CO/xanthine dehydrogenase Mo-binding subunit
VAGTSEEFDFPYDFDATAKAFKILARKAGRPVKLIHTREEEFLASHPRMPMRYWVRLGFSKAGKVLAKEIEALLASGDVAGLDASTAGLLARVRG